ncbi:hypothetical protein LXA43DRAFT_977057 [Ganoderma leucocontextum]|nr:hypothetical protein LXA43DRAFT_977057 [Ganoderma leucocontextum]
MFFNWGLQGMLTIQVYVYYLLFPKDPASLRYLVYGMLVYEWIQTGLITQVAFDNFVYGYGDVATLTAFHNTWFSVTIMCSLTSGVVQCYFAYRTWILAHSVVITSVIVVFSIIQMCIGIAGGIMLRVIDPSAAEASHVTPVISTWLAGAAFVDVIIAISMTWLLWRAKSGIKTSDDMINTLIRLVVETGTLTGPSTLLHECPALVLAKLYANTFLASLNNRYILRHLSANSAGIAVDSSTVLSADSFPMRFFKPGSSGASRGAEQRTVLSHQGHITVQEETFIARDLEVFPEGAKDGVSTFSGGMKQSDCTLNSMAGSYPV